MSLVGCFEDKRRFSDLSAMSRLGSRRQPISENSSGETGNRTPSATAAPQNDVSKWTYVKHALLNLYDYYRLNVR